MMRAVWLRNPKTVNILGDLLCLEPEVIS